MNTRIALKPSRRLLTGMALCALLLTQALGLLHRVLHAHGPAPALHAPHAQAYAAAQQHTLERLFAQHRDTQDCQVFDQLTQADATGFAVESTGAEPLGDLHVAACAAPDLAAQAAGYLARGPPRTA